MNFIFLAPVFAFFVLVLFAVFFKSRKVENIPSKNLGEIPRAYSLTKEEQCLYLLFFLEENDALDKFCNNFVLDCLPTSVDHSFTWMDTKEGHNYWAKLHERFCKDVYNMY